MVASKARRSSAALSAGTPGGATKGRAMAVGPTMSSSILWSYFSRPSRARENADEIGVSSPASNDVPAAIGERKGTKNRGMERKTTEKTADNSPSVHRRAY